MLNGIFLGVVEKTGDPERLGRVKVRVPAVYGVQGGSTGAVSVDDLPWALPMGLPAGESAQSGGASWLPQEGDQVAVQFLDGEPEKPVWAWLMQTRKGASALGLHQYETSGSGSLIGPSRAAWTRYGHTAEWTPGSWLATTSQGYRVFLLDGSTTSFDGRVSLNTALGQFLELDDSTRTATLNVLEDFYAMVGLEFNALAGNFRLESVNDAKLIVGTKLSMAVGGEAVADVTGDLSITGLSGLDATFAGTGNIFASTSLSLGTDGPMSLSFSNLSLGTGASEPFVLGTQLSTFLESLLTWLAAHTHTSGMNGSPTSPPIVPPVGVVQPQISQLLSTTIVGR